MALSDRELQDIIDYYRSDQAQTTVGAWRRGMPPVAADKSFRASIHRQLPLEVTSLRVDDPALLKEVAFVLRPVLSLYDRAAAYDLIVVDAEAPLMMSDSGVILLVTTGMLRRAQSDDELLGYVAHEVGHEYFVKYSVYSKHLFGLISNRGKEPLLAGKVISILGIIELQCDAFAALTLASLGYNPLEFVKGMEQSGKDFPKHKVGNHPPDYQRRIVVEGVVPSEALTIKSRRTKALTTLQERLRRQLLSH